MLTLTLARRFLFSKHRSAFARSLSYLAIGSVALSLAAFCLVLGVMEGFTDELQRRIIASSGAMKGYSITGVVDYSREVEAAIDAEPGVTGVRPVVQLPAILQGAGSVTADVIIETFDQPGDIQDLLTGESAQPGPAQILLGIGVADKISGWKGDTLSAVIVIPENLRRLGQPASVQAQLVVSGRFQTGVYEEDAGKVLMRAQDARELLGLPPGAAHILDITLADPHAAAAMAERLSERLEKHGIYFISWDRLRESLFKAIRLERLVMSLILGLFMCIAAFNILSALMTTSIEKRIEIAVLRAMGMSSGGIARLFLFAGAYVGAIGIALGVLLTLAGHAAIQYTSWFKLPSDIYDLDRLPSKLSPELLLIAAVVAVALAVLAALIPAVQMARIDPARALRRE